MKRNQSAEKKKEELTPRPIIKGKPLFIGREGKGNAPQRERKGEWPGKRDWNAEEEEEQQEGTLGRSRTLVVEAASIPESGMIVTQFGEARKTSSHSLRGGKNL